VKAVRRSVVFLNNEKGIVLVVCLLLLAVLVILGTTAVMTTTTDFKIGSNYKQNERAFYIAEAGIEEARARLSANFTPESKRISAPTGDETISMTSFQGDLNYTVTIKRQKEKVSPYNFLYWGDYNGDGISEVREKSTLSTASGKDASEIYLVTSTGIAPGAKKKIEVEMAKLPPITVTSALYVKAETTIQGTSTHVIGEDQCGGDDVPGIKTTLASSTVSNTGNPTVSGSTSETWSVVGGATNMDVKGVIDNWKSSANYSYAKVSATDTGMNWGTPTAGATLQDASSCSINNIVYYNTYNSTADTLTDIKLAGGTTGCGILLVDGDLEMHGNLSWYGIILVSGSVTYSGGGDKNITGAVIAGGSVDADLVGGNANIVYCSTAISNQSVNQPLHRLSWKWDE